MTDLSKSRQVGLARGLSKLGYCSRSDAFDLIRAGQVQLNGRVIRNPQSPVRLEQDHIAVAGKAIAAAVPVYLMMNKPRGIVTTAADEKDRKTVYTLLEKDSPWVAPVGRLDKASEGLLLLTNDSEWSARVLAPQTHLDKTYHVQIGVVAGQELLNRLQTGFAVGDGARLQVKRARVLRGGEKNSWLEMILDEGRNRHIRKMLDHLGIEVLRLVRVAIGPLVLGNLAKGTVRALSETEKIQIHAALQHGKPRPR